MQNIPSTLKDKKTKENVTLIPCPHGENITDSKYSERQIHKENITDSKYSERQRDIRKISLILSILKDRDIGKCH